MVLILSDIYFYFLPLFRRACGQSVELARLIRQASLKEMPDDICQVK